MWKFYNVLRLILFLPWTIYFNFRVLPFKLAVKLPIWFYVRPTFLCCGTVKVASEHIRPGIVKLGGANLQDESMETVSLEQLWHRDIP